MKRIMVAAILFLVLQQTFGQSKDTTNVLSRPLKPEPVPSSSARPESPVIQPYNGADPLIRIRLDEVPPKMKLELQNRNLEGWESAPIYKDEDKKVLSIDIRQGEGIETYRFKEDGELIDVTPYTE